MELSKSNWVWLCLGVLIGMLIIVMMNEHFGVNGELPTQPDTTYNKVKLDSINIQIGKRDTTIYNLKIKLKDDVERSYQLDDSAAVKLFKQLVTQSDTIK